MRPGGIPRCGWVGSEPLFRTYHDREWGVPVHDDRRLFEFLVLEGAQAGLSWITILKKRDAYRAAFAGFDPKAVAGFDGRKVAQLLAAPGIVRNRLKVESAITLPRFGRRYHRGPPGIRNVGLPSRRPGSGGQPDGAGGDREAQSIMTPNIRRKSGSDRPEPRHPVDLEAPRIEDRSLRDSHGRGYIGSDGGKRAAAFTGGVEFVSVARNNEIGRGSV